MYRVICSKWFISGVSLTVGAAIGASLNGDSTNRCINPSHGLLNRVPVIPIPSVDAATDLTTYQGGGQMNPNLNQNAWNNLEQYCRSLTKHYMNVFVCTGPLYLPRQEPDGKMYVKYQVMGRNHVAVPTHFFKVVILEKQRGEVELRSYVMPNTPVDNKIPLERFLVPIESIERASGLLFVPNIMKRTNSLLAITAGGK
ncbi:unnamed protein product [Oncorhynchus mykiss]|uniref:Endonuclease G, mitochondrial n=1 Tax=Oncorhynchus mykiss TaxID=8022 RepID=A0A060XIQ0_ONCMY|nr:unnamed protein product [Oncorhynchus mykiss]